MSRVFDFFFGFIKIAADVISPNISDHFSTVKPKENTPELQAVADFIQLVVYDFLNHAFFSSLPE